MNLGGTIRINKFGIFVLILLILLFILYTQNFRKTIDSSIEDNVDLRKLLIGAIEASILGGRKVKYVFDNPSQLNERSKGRTKEGANDPVTYADELSNCAMYYSLKHTFPRVRLISEEDSDESSCTASHSLELDPNVLKDARHLKEELVPADKLTVWIDPLDATQEFTEKLTKYVTTMVCVALEGVPIIGVIHEPFTDQTYFAWVGKYHPTFPASDSNRFRVITSRSHKGKVDQQVKQAFKDVEVVTAGGAGYKALQVVMRNVSVYIHTTTGIKKWDICAGDAILRAAGGRLSTLSNKDIMYGSEDEVVNTEGVFASLEKHDELIKQWTS